MVNGYGQVASAYAGLNRVEEAKATLKAAVLHKGSATNYHAEAAPLDWAQGNTDEMEKDLQEAAKTPQGELNVLGFRCSLAGYRGQVKQAKEYSRQAGEALDRLHLQNRPDVDAQLAALEALVGDDSEAARVADGALHSARTLSVMGIVGAVDGILVKIEKANAIADEIQRTHPNDTIAINVTVPLIRAIAALNPANAAKADPARAIDLLNTAALYGRANGAVCMCAGGRMKRR